MLPRTHVLFFAVSLSLCSCSPSRTHNTSSAEAGIDVDDVTGDDATGSSSRDSGTRDSDGARPAPLKDAATQPAVLSDAGSDPAHPSCHDGTHEDVDGDGFTLTDGDCDDCQKTINPAAYDVPGNMRDEDCSGSDAVEAECDQMLQLASTAAEDGARALGLCSFPAASSRAWGVTSARYTDASGTGELSNPLAVGILPEFGAAKPRAGTALLALSSGVARAPSQPGATSGCDSFGEEQDCGFGILTCSGGGAAPPAGYPKQSSVCKDQDKPFTDEPVIYDQAALELKIRVPSNASAFSFESSFYTSEYPEWICEVFNDFFVVFKEPKPADYPDGNILFDKNHDPIGVNNGLLAVCDPTVQRRQAVKTFTCDQGTALLEGTGYGRGEAKCGAASGGGSTGWLKTSAPVKPGELITLRFAIWDTTDSSLDSTALLDHFSWTTFEGEPEMDIPIETEPVIPI
jgi:hypothetical protein